MSDEYNDQALPAAGAFDLEKLKADMKNMAPEEFISKVAEKFADGTYKFDWTDDIPTFNLLNVIFEGLCGEKIESPQLSTSHQDGYSYSQADIFKHISDRVYELRNNEDSTATETGAAAPQIPEAKPEDFPVSEQLEQKVDVSTGEKPDNNKPELSTEALRALSDSFVDKAGIKESIGNKDGYVAVGKPRFDPDTNIMHLDFRGGVYGVDILLAKAPNTGADSKEEVLYSAKVNDLYIGRENVRDYVDLLTESDKTTDPAAVKFAEFFAEPYVDRVGEALKSLEKIAYSRGQRFAKTTQTPKAFKCPDILGRPHELSMDIPLKDGKSGTLTLKIEYPSLSKITKPDKDTLKDAKVELKDLRVDGKVIKDRDLDKMIDKSKLSDLAEQAKNAFDASETVYKLDVQTSEGERKPDNIRNESSESTKTQTEKYEERAEYHKNKQELEHTSIYQRTDVFRNYHRMAEIYNVYKAGGELRGRPVTRSDVFEAALFFVTRSNIIETFLARGIGYLIDLIFPEKGKDVPEVLKGENPDTPTESPSDEPENNDDGSADGGGGDGGGDGPENEPNGSPADEQDAPVKENEEDLESPSLMDISPVDTGLMVDEIKETPKDRDETTETGDAQQIQREQPDTGGNPDSTSSTPIDSAEQSANDREPDKSSEPVAVKNEEARDFEPDHAEPNQERNPRPEQEENEARTDANAPENRPDANAEKGSSEVEPGESNEERSPQPEPDNQEAPESHEPVEDDENAPASEHFELTDDTKQSQSEKSANEQDAADAADVAMASDEAETAQAAEKPGETQTPDGHAEAPSDDQNFRSSSEEMAHAAEKKEDVQVPAEKPDDPVSSAVDMFITVGSMDPSVTERNDLRDGLMSEIAHTLIDPNSPEQTYANLTTFVDAITSENIIPQNSDGAVSEAGLTPDNYAAAANDVSGALVEVVGVHPMLESVLSDFSDHAVEKLEGAMLDNGYPLADVFSAVVNLTVPDMSVYSLAVETVDAPETVPTDNLQFIDIDPYVVDPESAAMFSASILEDPEAYLAAYTDNGADISLITADMPEIVQFESDLVNMSYELPDADATNPTHDAEYPRQDYDITSIPQSNNNDYNQDVTPQYELDDYRQQDDNRAGQDDLFARIGHIDVSEMVE